MTPEIKQRIDAIRHGDVPKGYKKVKIGIVPTEWEETNFKTMFGRLNRKNTTGNTNVLTISAQHGLISQEDFFNKSIASEDKSNYFFLKRGEFAYNKSYSNGYPFGALKPLVAYESGIVSPLYICFSATRENKCPEYYAQYFEGGLMNHEIQAFAQEGARNHGLLNISVGDFFNSAIVVPPLPEQQKIAEILTTQDKVIELKEKRIAQKQRQKKYLMQQLLTGKKRLKGFSGEWKKQRLSEVLKERKEKNVAEDLLICSVAVQKGVIGQIEHLGRSYAATDTSNYSVVGFGDIVYTKSPTGDFPYGIIKQSHIQDNVAVSPLYGVYIPVNYWLGYILHTYFQYAVNVTNYLLPIVHKGAKNTITISNEVFLSNSLYLPMDEEEQKRISELFIVVDREISLLQKDLEQEKLKKKVLMQLLLTGIVRVSA